MKPNVLLFVQIPPPVHGVSQINFQIANSNRINDNFNIELLEIKFSNSFLELRTYTIRKFFTAFLLSIKLVSKLITFRPALVYFSLMPIGLGFYRDAFFLLIIKLFRVKVILHLHNRGIHLVKNRLTKLLYRYLFNNCNIIHLSENLLNEEIKPLELRKSKQFIVHNGIEDVRIEPNRDKNKTQLLFLSNLMPEKGVFILLEIFKNLLGNNKALELHIIGSPTKAFDMRFKAFIQQNQDISDKINYHGSLFNGNKHKVMAESDIFIFPSVFQEECMPLSIIEAMQFCLPVVAFQIGAIEELVKNGVNGFLIKPFNISAFSDQLQLLISNKKLRREMGQSGRDIYLKIFTSEKFEGNMLSVFNRVIYE